MTKVATIFLTSCLFLTNMTFAQIPNKISYQGVLTDSDGLAVADGNKIMTFRIYDVAEGGQALWEETQRLPVVRGVFNAILGSKKPLTLPFDKPYWLGIRVGDEHEYSPRIELTASPYSLGSKVTVSEPEAGTDFVLRDSLGQVTHVLTQTGDTHHSGSGSYDAGLRVKAAEADTGLLVISRTGAAIIAISGDSALAALSARSAAIAPGNAHTFSGGIFGGSDNQPGVAGNSGKGAGVSGSSHQGPGVKGSSDFAYGVDGNGSLAGVRGQSSSGQGGYFISAEGAGVRAKGEPAGQFEGDVRAQGEVYARSLHVVTFDEDGRVENLLTNFWADGTASFGNTIRLTGENARLIFPDGTEQLTAASADGGFDGTLADKPLILTNAAGDTVFRVNTNGESRHKGSTTFLNGIKLTEEGSEPGLFIEQKAIILSDEDGSEAIRLDRDKAFFLKKVSLRDTLEIKDAQGNVTTRFLPDGTSLHARKQTVKGGVTLEGGEFNMTDAEGNPAVLMKDGLIQFAGQVNIFAKGGKDLRHVLSEDGKAFHTGSISAAGIVVTNTDGDTVASFLPDGTSLHTGIATFKDNVILQGADDKGIKLVNSEGEALAGFGRKDQETGQRIGVFARAEESGDLAAVFEGQVDVLGEITASGLHIANAKGDSMVDFFADGTSRHHGLGTYEAGLRVVKGGRIEVVNEDGSLALSVVPNADPQTQYTMKVQGNFEVEGAKNFRIDHPLDPENKYLLHTSVESPDMKNVYDGVVTLDENGQAWVELPNWFEALNKDFRYQLTCIGGYAPVYIAEKIQDNRFKIAGGKAELEVSWQVTGIRNDAWARANRRPIEGYKVN